MASLCTCCWLSHALCCFPASLLSSEGSALFFPALECLSTCYRAQNRETLKVLPGVLCSRQCSQKSGRSRECFRECSQGIPSVEENRKSTLERTLGSILERTPISESTSRSTLGSTFGGFSGLGCLGGRQTLNLVLCSQRSRALLNISAPPRGKH